MAPDVLAMAPPGHAKSKLRSLVLSKLQMAIVFKKSRVLMQDQRASDQHNGLARQCIMQWIEIPGLVRP